MNFKLRWLMAVSALVPAMLISCGSDDEEPPPQACSTADNSGCEAGQVCQPGRDGNPACFCDAVGNSGCGQDQVCEVLVDGNAGCFAPVNVKGRVFDLASSAAVEGARILARDANDAAASGIAVSDANGEYSLRVPAARRDDGTIADNSITLRADAAGYLTFPEPPRVALPISMSSAAGDPPIVQSSATDIGLIAIDDTSGLGTISGTVHADAPGGTVVVAGGQSGAGGGRTGVADGDGSYVVFNVPAGSVSVRGYKIGLQLDTNSADVTAGMQTEGVDLNTLGDATAVVSGKVDIVNPGNGSNTSVILAVDETFNENAARGEAPPGLRAPNISGGWSISGVPDGKYVVLAAFENDFLVRDPDTANGGTSLVRITVAGQDVAVAEQFKITGSLDEVSPDAEEPVSGTPVFKFADDSGEDHYEIQVFDAFGNKTWEDLQVPGVTGSKLVEVTYGGPALEPGMIYQFRATSIKTGGTPISRTEDLRGVFTYK